MSNQCDVFISYSRRDYVDCNSVIIPNNILSKIKDTLTQNGLTYWFDEEGIYSGQEFTSVITKAIREAKVLLFVSSRNSNASEWTSNEIAIAKRLNKPIIPFCLDDSPYNDSVMMMIASLDYIDGTVEQTALPKLIRALRHHIDTLVHRSEKEILLKSEKDVQQKTVQGESSVEEELFICKKWFRHPSMTNFQELLNYVQSCVYALCFFFTVWTSLFGILAIYNEFQFSQFMLLLSLGMALFASIQLRTGRKFWWAVICLCDILIVLYTSVLARFLFVNWNTFSSLNIPSSMRYRWLYMIGQEMEKGNHFFLHPILLSVALLHVVLIFSSFCKSARRTN